MTKWFGVVEPVNSSRKLEDDYIECRLRLVSEGPPSKDFYKMPCKLEIVGTEYVSIAELKISFTTREYAVDPIKQLGVLGFSPNNDQVNTYLDFNLFNIDEFIEDVCLHDVKGQQFIISLTEA